MSLKNQDYKSIIEIYENLSNTIKEDSILDEHGIEIFHLTSFDEAKKLAQGTDWELCKNEKLWQAYRDYGTDFFVIETNGKKIGVTVHTNNAKEIYDAHNKVIPEQELQRMLDHYSIDINDLEASSR